MTSSWSARALRQRRRRASALRHGHDEGKLCGHVRSRLHRSASWDYPISAVRLAELNCSLWTRYVSFSASVWPVDAQRLCFYLKWLDWNSTPPLHHYLALPPSTCFHFAWTYIHPLSVILSSACLPVCLSVSLPPPPPSLSLSHTHTHTHTYTHTHTHFKKWKACLTWL